MESKMFHIADSIDEVISSLADFITEKAQESILHSGQFSFVLSGGSSPRQLYQWLSSASYRERIDWQKVFFFFGDERHVPLSHPSSNFRMVENVLFQPLNIRADHIFAMDTSLPPAQTAKKYEREISDYFDGNTPTFDFVLLGLGDNSHTASLFPYTSVLKEDIKLVSECYVEEVKMDRITMTAKLLNQAHHVAFLVFGSGKAKAVFHILEDDIDTDAYPAQLIKPYGDIHWFLDRQATLQLKKHYF